MKTYVDRHWLIRCEDPKNPDERLGGIDRQYLTQGAQTRRDKRSRAKSFYTRSKAVKRLRSLRDEERTARRGWKFHLVTVTTWELT